MRVAIAGFRRGRNRFNDNFVAAIESQRNTVMPFDWNTLGTSVADCVLLNWPTRFFSAPTFRARARALQGLSMMWGLRKIVGTRFVWVVHNLRPHDLDGAVDSGLVRRFMGQLDGLIHLSDVSRAALRAAYGPLPPIPELTIVHGHYRDARAAPLLPPSPPADARLRLAFVGRVRPYKNIETLVQAVLARQRGDIELQVTGFAQDADLGTTLRALVHGSQAVRLDLRDITLTNRELDDAVDRADAVILPYRDILNSGSALLALSRGRPVIAPAIGALPELQRNVGADWVHLYDGDLDDGVLSRAANWLRMRRTAAMPDLSRYDWEPIGRQVSTFLGGLARPRLRLPLPAIPGHLG